MSHYLGVDLAWGEGSGIRVAKETGLVCLDERGNILDAGWARGRPGPQRSGPRPGSTAASCLGTSSDPDDVGRRAVIIAPARAEQRR